MYSTSHIAHLSGLTLFLYKFAGFKVTKDRQEFQSLAFIQCHSIWQSSLPNCKALHHLFIVSLGLLSSLEGTLVQKILVLVVYLTKLLVVLTLFFVPFWFMIAHGRHHGLSLRMTALFCFHIIWSFLVFVVIFVLFFRFLFLFTSTWRWHQSTSPFSSQMTPSMTFTMQFSHSVSFSICWKLYVH